MPESQVKTSKAPQGKNETLVRLLAKREVPPGAEKPV